MELSSETSEDHLVFEVVIMQEIISLHNRHSSGTKPFSDRSAKKPR